jgi:hypothetical protein
MLDLKDEVLLEAVKDVSHALQKQFHWINGEDLESAANFGVGRAAIWWTDSKTKTAGISTFKWYARQKAIDELRHTKEVLRFEDGRAKRNYVAYFINMGEHDVQFHSHFIGTPEMQCFMELSEVMLFLTKRQQKVINLRLEGKKLNEIGRLTNQCESQVYNELIAIGNILNEYGWNTPVRTIKGNNKKCVASHK